jgi:hypothetical protein
MMTYADACEGAKSNSLARNCKLLGMTLELWDKEWADNWKRDHATKVGGDWVKKSAVHAPATQAQATPKKSDDPLAPENVIANVRKEWKSAAIKKGILKDPNDAEGMAILKNLLGDLSTGLTVENAANNRGEGIKLIEEYLMF